LGGKPLWDRVSPTPAKTLKFFNDAGLTDIRDHPLSASQKRALQIAVGNLTPLHRKVLGTQLLSISFLDGMPNNALTSYVVDLDPKAGFTITFRAGALDESASQLVTKKEQSCFLPDAEGRTVMVDIGGLDAMTYLLLHEGTHVVDRSLGLTPMPDVTVPTGQIAEIWNTRVDPLEKYRFHHIYDLRYRAGGKLIPIDDAPQLYSDLLNTPFASLYGSTNWYDDLAELVAWTHITQHLSQPYNIDIRKADALVSSYQPLSSAGVQSRLANIAFFYS